LRRAEFGFLGVIVLTWRQTPRLNGQASSTGDLVLYCTGRRGLRTSWLIVGMSQSFPFSRSRRVLAPVPIPSRAGTIIVSRQSSQESTARAECRGRHEGLETPPSSH